MSGESNGGAKRGRVLGCALLLSVVIGAGPARAQLNGENLLGDTGVKGGTQPAPGTYAGFLYYRYDTDVIRDASGQQITLDPTGAGSQTIQAFCPLFIYVTPYKLLGANYGVMAVMPFGNGALEAPGFGLSEEVSTGASDLYVVPIQLGWHLERTDAIASLGLFAPTGRYSAGADDNVGKGMWSYELAAGATQFFDEKKTLSFATTAYWEIHSKKEGELHLGSIVLRDLKVGQLLTLEGGLGKSFLEGAAHVGAAYYAQWKLTQDDFGFPVPPPGGSPVGKHRVWGFGPDITFPIATKLKLYSLVNVRYLWETGAQLKTEGQSLVITASFPLPSISIPPKE